MQPRPSAETRSPWLPRALDFIDYQLGGMPNASVARLQAPPHAAGEREQAAPNEHVHADHRENGEADGDPGDRRLDGVDTARLAGNGRPRNEREDGDEEKDGTKGAERDELCDARRHVMSEASGDEGVQSRARVGPTEAHGRGTTSTPLLLTRWETSGSGGSASS